MARRWQCRPAHRGGRINEREARGEGDRTREERARFAILFVLKDAALGMWHRLMDAADSGVVVALSGEAASVEGEQEVDDVPSALAGLPGWRPTCASWSTKPCPRVRAIGWAEEVSHRLFHAQPKLASIIVHVDPCGHSGSDCTVGPLTTGPERTLDPPDMRRGLIRRASRRSMAARRQDQSSAGRRLVRGVSMREEPLQHVACPRLIQRRRRP